MTKGKLHLMIDSGAYSAWAQKKDITLKGYMRFLAKYRDYYSYCVNLDVIPGNKGKVPTSADIEDAASQTWKNSVLLRKEGFEPLPVFHLGERRYWLEKMLGEGFNYIGLGGTVGKSVPVRRKWFDEQFAFLCGSQGFPKVKVHGFGMTTFPLLLRYPWYSADSLAWIRWAAYGVVWVPRMTDDGYDYFHHPYTISLSSRVKNSQNSQYLDPKRDFRSMGPISQNYVLSYLKQEGFDPDELAECYKLRMQLNARFMKRVVENYKVQPFNSRARGLFSIVTDDHSSKKAAKDHLVLFFTVNASREVSEVMQKEDARDRLFSYFWFMDRELWDLKHYCKTGDIIRTKKREKMK